MSNMLDATSEELLKKALQLFLLYGYRKTTMADVALAGAVSRQTLYSRYDNKEALFAALIEALCQQAFERGQTELTAARPVWTAVEAALDQWLGKAIDELNISPHGDEIAEAWASRRGDGGEARIFDFRMQTALAEFLQRADGFGDLNLAGAGLAALDLAGVLVQSANGVRAAVTSSAEFAERIKMLVQVYAGATRTR